MQLIRGDKLPANVRDHVLRAYIYRWTTENLQREAAYGPCPKCDIRSPYVNETSANGHNHPTIPLQTDEAWLSEHAFYVTDAGELSARNRVCEPAYFAD